MFLILGYETGLRMSARCWGLVVIGSGSLVLMFGNYTGLKWMMDYWAGAGVERFEVGVDW